MCCLKKWKLWRQNKGLKIDEDDPDSAKAKARQIILQNEKLAFQIGVLKKQYAETATVEKWGAEFVAPGTCKRLPERL